MKLKERRVDIKKLVDGFVNSSKTGESLLNLPGLENIVGAKPAIGPEASSEKVGARRVGFNSPDKKG